MIFDGKIFAKEIEAQIKDKILNFVQKPKIVSVIVGDDPASILYTKLKKAAAERVGVQFEVIKLEITNDQSSIIKQKIKKIGERADVTGVMVQLPLPNHFKGSTLKVLGAIPLDKDVDGLRWEESGIVPATVKAVIKILERIAEKQSFEPRLWDRKFVVVGARGAVGRPLVHFLKKRGVDVTEIEWDTELPFGRLPKGQVVISCVGKAGIVTGEMVSDGVVAIDVGMNEKIITNPKFSNSQIKIVVGDMTSDVYQKASIAVPVPGGVGPVTIACLLQNALEIDIA